MAYLVVVEGLNELREFGVDFKKNIALAAQRAINKTADATRTIAQNKIRKQINFPASYLSPSKGRLTVAKRASADHLEATIRGRHAATSLARFITAGPKKGNTGITVQVKPGRATFLRRAFVIRLRAGNADIETKSNLGLAVRLKKGERLRNKNKPLKLGSGLYLLFGPSVDQVFSTVSEEISPQAAVDLENEFLRLLEL